MSVRISDINIVCDAALDQDINQEIGFLGEQDRISYLEYEEQRDIPEGIFCGVEGGINTKLLKDQNE